MSTLVKDIRFIRKELKYTQLMMANLKDWISHLCSAWSTERRRLGFSFDQVVIFSGDFSRVDVEREVK